MTSTPDHTTPPSPDPKAGHNPGYAEPQPRDKTDAQQQGGKKDHAPRPDDGGLDRRPESDPDPARDRGGKD